VLVQPPTSRKKVTEIGRISVVMCDSDQFFDGQLLLTHYQDPSTKLGFWVGTFLKDKKNKEKMAKTLWRPLASEWLTTE